MADEKIEAIIVGGGIAGLTAANVLAREGAEVLLIERGTYCGAKNVTGGKLYSDTLEKVFEGFAQNAPVERLLTREEVYAMSPEASERIDMGGIAAPESDSKAYSVLRAKLDMWLAEQAENEGAMLVQNIVVTDLVVEDGRVCGVVAGDETMLADEVILADGENSLLAQRLGMMPELDMNRSCVGVKEVIVLDEATINSRFGLENGEGAEMMFIGDKEHGQLADGFIYTNKDSLSVGIEFVIGDIYKTGKSVPEMLEEFKARPEVAKLIEGGRLTEYSAHVVHHGGAEKPAKLFGDGVIIAGDAAGLVANYGFTVRGMDMAAESGRLAAETVLAARECGDFSAEKLSEYQQAIEKSFISADLAKCENYFANK